MLCRRRAVSLSVGGGGAPLRRRYQISVRIRQMRRLLASSGVAQARMSTGPARRAHYPASMTCSGPARRPPAVTARPGRRLHPHQSHHTPVAVSRCGLAASHSTQHLSGHPCTPPYHPTPEPHTSTHPSTAARLPTAPLRRWDHRSTIHANWSKWPSVLPLYCPIAALRQ